MTEPYSRMKRAVKVPGKVSLPANTLENLRSHIESSSLRRHLSDCELGEVETRSQPDWLSLFVQQALSNLNSSAKNQYKFVEHPSIRELSAIAYGKGSVPTHSDSISELSLLLFLGGLEEVDGRLKPNREGGEFYAGGQMTPLDAGDCLVFDDNEKHSWLCNGYWFFAVNAITRV